MAANPAPEQPAPQADYLVVVNDEEQYSIWWADRDLPAGWHAEGTQGTREQCLERIGEVWTDMRPLSLRRRMERSTVAGNGAVRDDSPGAAA